MPIREQIRVATGGRVDLAEALAFDADMVPRNSETKSAVGPDEYAPVLPPAALLQRGWSNNQLHEEFDDPRKYPQVEDDFEAEDEAWEDWTNDEYPRRTPGPDLNLPLHPDSEISSNAQFMLQEQQRLEERDYVWELEEMRDYEWGLRRELQAEEDLLGPHISRFRVRPIPLVPHSVDTVMVAQAIEDSERLVGRDYPETLPPGEIPYEARLAEFRIAELPNEANPDPEVQLGLDEPRSHARRTRLRDEERPPLVRPDSLYEEIRLEDLLTPLPASAATEAEEDDDVVISAREPVEYSAPELRLQPGDWFDYSELVERPLAGLADLPASELFRDIDVSSGPDPDPDSGQAHEPDWDRLVFRDPNFNSRGVSDGDEELEYAEMQRLLESLYADEDLPPDEAGEAASMPDDNEPYNEELYIQRMPFEDGPPDDPWEWIDLPDEIRDEEEARSYLFTHSPPPPPFLLDLCDLPPAIPPPAV
jgi:hypothetical protein